MEKFISVIKKGNVPSGLAALGNAFIAFLKLIAASVYGNAAMFASGMHSLADTANQAVIFVGSILGEKEPTEKFPNGFGRVNHLVCLFAVAVISVLAFETVKEGFHIIANPTESGEGFVINVIVMFISIALDGSVWLKAVKEINHEARSDVKGIASFNSAFENFKFATPSTRLVFIEDMIAVSGGNLALIAIILSHYFEWIVLEGIVSVIIGLMMITMAIKIALDNTAGLIGVAAPEEFEDEIADIILSHPEVKDIKELKLVQEGSKYHVDSDIELNPNLTVAQAEDIIEEIEEDIMETGKISDAVFEISEDDGIRNWDKEQPIVLK